MAIYAETKYKAASGTSRCSVVLHDASSASHHPYVTHVRNDDLGGYHQGHYFKTLEEAKVDYDKRVAEWDQTMERRQD